MYCHKDSMSGIFTRPKMGPSLGFATDFFFLSLRWGNYYGLFYSGGRQSHCFTSSAIVRSKELRQVEVEFASSLVGVHPVTFARVSEQNQEKRSLGGM